jgi:hypothetical protein
MQIPQLRIDQSFAELGLKQQQATMQIRQPMAELSLKQPMAELKIHISESKLEIDQTEAFADANLKSPLRMANEWVSKAKQKAMQNVAQKVQEGNRLMKIEHQNESIIPQIAKEKSMDPPKPFKLGYMPSSPFHVKFNYTPSDVQVDAKVSKAVVKANTKEPIIHFNQGDLSVYLRQKASIRMKVDQSI